jgi:hypothetical protein
MQRSPVCRIAFLSTLQIYDSESLHSKAFDNCPHCYTHLANQATKASSTHL